MSSLVDRVLDALTWSNDKGALAVLIELQDWKAKTLAMIRDEDDVDYGVWDRIAEMTGAPGADRPGSETAVSDAGSKMPVGGPGDIIRSQPSRETESPALPPGAPLPSPAKTAEDFAMEETEHTCLPGGTGYGDACPTCRWTRRIAVAMSLARAEERAQCAAFARAVAEEEAVRVHDDEPGADTKAYAVSIAQEVARRIEAEEATR